MSEDRRGGKKINLEDDGTRADNAGAENADGVTTEKKTTASVLKGSNAEAENADGVTTEKKTTASVLKGSNAEAENADGKITGQGNDRKTTTRQL